jgi:hypothetical protein
MKTIKTQRTDREKSHLSNASVATAIMIRKHANDSMRADGYRVEVEALIGDKWIRHHELEGSDRIESWRFFDTTGRRGKEFTTIGEMEAERDLWIQTLRS